MAYVAMQCLYPSQQIIAHHFFVSLMDDKNLIIQDQALKVKLFLQILNSIQALNNQHC